MSGKNILRSLAALVGLIATGEFLGSNTHSLGAQEGDIEGLAIAVGGTIPVIVGEFDIPVWWSNNPSGLAYNTLTDQYAITDPTDDEVYIVDNQGELVSQFDTSGYPSANPLGIAYDSIADEYAIVDSTADEIYFVSTAGVLSSQCDTAGVGILNPRGIAFNSATGFFAVIDSSLDEVFILNGACAIQAQFDLSSVGATNAQGITYRADTNQYEVVDSTADEFYIFDASVGGLGALVSQFDIGGSKINLPGGGLAHNPDDRVSAITYTTWDQVFLVDFRGTLVSTFDTEILSIQNPSDLAYNTATDRLLITDDVLNTVLFVNPTTGTTTGFCSLVILGALNAHGIAYLAGTNELAITDQTTDEVYITPTSCIGGTSFDTGNMQSETPSGIGVDLIFGALMLTDTQDDAIRTTDTAGNLVAQCPGAGLGFDGGNGGGPIDGMFNILDIATSLPRVISPSSTAPTMRWSSLIPRAYPCCTSTPPVCRRFSQKGLRSITR